MSNTARSACLEALYCTIGFVRSLFDGDLDGVMGADPSGRGEKTTGRELSNHYYVNVTAYYV